MELKVISFNIRCRDDKNNNSIKERAPRLDKIISSYGADLIGLQEYRPAWRRHIRKNFGDKYDMYIKYRTRIIGREATPILWRKDRFECLKKGYFWLSDTPWKQSKGWDEKYNIPRMCVYVVLRDRGSGKIFTFMNTHLGFGDAGQIKSVNLIYEYSKKISSFPTFIVGDFNMNPDSLSYELMSKKFTDVNSVTENDIRATYHGYHPEKKTDNHIDYIFADKNIKPVLFKIIDDAEDGLFPSDHYGLYALLEI